MTDSGNVKKVVIIGPECTGKSELSEYLAGYFNTCWVPEFARSYLDKLNRPYHEHDLISIARGQIDEEDKHLPKARKVMICDTNLLVIKIWSNFKYGRCDQEILQLIQSRTYDLFLLTYIDLPWQFDPQREHPEKRKALWEIYQSELSNVTAPVVIIKGQREKRRQTAVNAIQKMI